MSNDPLIRSRALWNRAKLDLDSDETLAQLMDRGECEAWRELYARARTDALLRRRMLAAVLRVPLALPHFWLAALTSLGEVVDFDAKLPSYDDCV
jgi:hypothetical protein